MTTSAKREEKDADQELRQLRKDALYMALEANRETTVTAKELIVTATSLLDFINS